ncbi:MAG: hypothetical protein O2780_06915 [Proteobacteria bacterium]|nr:hypothetical protein [Pseudomonadota bacterium]MDA1300944.1 hypothetical protein [Pseudomonadota bacterium]
MSSFLKGLWSRTRKAPEVRHLDHPRSLQAGDLLKVSDSYGLPSQLRDQTFKVVAITTQQFEHEFSTTFTLQSAADDRVDLTIEEDGGRETAAFTFSIKRDLVEQLFDLDEFGSIFDDESATSLRLRQTDALAELGVEGLVADAYHQISSGERGYYYQKDYRGSAPPTYEGVGEPFDYYCLISDGETHGIEIEVYEGGETDVCLTLYRDIADISELWPAEKGLTESG